MIENTGGFKVGQELDQTDVLMLGMCFAELDVCVWMHLEKGCIQPETLILKHRRLKRCRKTETCLGSEHLFSTDLELSFL